MGQIPWVKRGSGANALCISIFLPISSRHCVPSSRSLYSYFSKLWMQHSICASLAFKTQTHWKLSRWPPLRGAETECPSPHCSVCLQFFDLDAMQLWRQRLSIIHYQQSWHGTYQKKISASFAFYFKIIISTTLQEAVNSLSLSKSLWCYRIFGIWLCCFIQLAPTYNCSCCLFTIYTRAPITLLSTRTFHMFVQNNCLYMHNNNNSWLS